MFVLFVVLFAVLCLFLAVTDVCNVLMLWGVAGASVFLFISWGNVLLWGDYVIYWE